MFLKLIIILIVFNSLSDSKLLSFDKKPENDFYRKLVLNFQQNSSEPKEINKLLEILDYFNEYGARFQRHPSEVDSNLFDRSAFSFVTNILKNVLEIVGFKNLFYSLKEGFSTALTCLGCHTLMNLLVSSLFGRETMAFAAYEVCAVLRLSTPRVCRGIIDQMKEQVDYIRNYTRLTPNEMCGVLLGTQCYIGKSENLYWKIDIPKKLDKYNKIKKDKVEDSEKVYQIMQVTDIHLDQNYLIGSESVCGEPLCCRRVNSMTGNKKSAGYWGTYPCDIPFVSVDSAFINMAQNARNVDLWYYTGDIVPHDIWQYDRSSNLMNSEIIAKFLEKFAKVMVLPAIGNHESVPVNSFPPPSIKNEFSISWLYDELANYWSKWLPEQALKTIRYAGYYSIKIRPGFRVIVVNTNYCARLNIWSLYDPQDPANHLKWLIQELLLAEKVGDNVHIVGHIPPDNRECTQAWLYNFLDIVKRFKDTIVGQFYGHTHADEFRVLYSNSNISDPIGYEFVSPSLTTYETYNPAYRIFTTKQNGVITDVDTFFFNLTQANKLSEYDSQPELPVWYYEYSMARNYSMTDLSYIGFDKLVKKIIKDNYFLQMYYSFYYRFSDFMSSPYCDNACKDKLITDIIIGNPYKKKPKSILSTG